MLIWRKALSGNPLLSRFWLFTQAYQTSSDFDILSNSWWIPWNADVDCSARSHTDGRRQTSFTNIRLVILSWPITLIYLLGPPLFGKITLLCNTKLCFRSWPRVAQVRRRTWGVFSLLQRLQLWRWWRGKHHIPAFKRDDLPWPWLFRWL